MARVLSVRHVQIQIQQKLSAYISGRRSEKRKQRKKSASASVGGVGVREKLPSAIIFKGGFNKNYRGEKDAFPFRISQRRAR